jgi:hypothetical protein
LELIGFALLTSVTIALSTALAFILGLIPAFRRYVLTTLITPPVGIVSLILIRWTILDKAPVCGPDPEWDHCPSGTANIVGWAIWIVLVCVIATSSFWIQGRASKGMLFRDKETIRIFDQN